MMDKEKDKRTGKTEASFVNYLTDLKPPNWEII